MVKHRTVMLDDGTVEHTVAPTDHASQFEYEQYIVHTNLNGDPDLFAVHVIEDGETVFSTTFRRRSVSFDPLTEINRGQTDKLSGVTMTDNYTAPSDDIETILNGFGFTVVPDGEWWLHE